LCAGGDGASGGLGLPPHACPRLVQVKNALRPPPALSADAEADDTWSRPGAQNISGEAQGCNGGEERGSVGAKKTKRRPPNGAPIEDSTHHLQSAKKQKVVCRARSACLSTSICRARSREHALPKTKSEGCVGATSRHLPRRRSPQRGKKKRKVEENVIFCEKKS